MENAHNRASMRQAQTMLITDDLQGLSTQEVAARRAEGRGTILPPPTDRTYLQIIREDVFTLINNILFALCIGLLLLGQISEGIVSAGVVLFNVIISVFQGLVDEGAVTE